MRRSFSTRSLLSSGSLAIVAWALAAGAGVGCGGSSGGNGEGPGDGGEGGTDATGSDSSEDTTSGDTGSPMTDSGVDSGQQDSSPTDSSSTDAKGDADAAGPLAISPLTKPSAFKAIFDAVPNSTGTAVYLTGVDATGTIGVFWVNVASTPSTATAVAAGGPLTAPFGIAISSDDKTVYVADPGAIDSGGGDQGVIFSIKASGGTPAQVAGSSGIQARGITVTTSGGADTLVFTGFASGIPGVFDLAAGGGTASTRASGSPFVDPSGVAADSAGTLWVMDVTAGGTHRADIIKVTGSTAAPIVSDLFVGYPAGITLDVTGSNVVFSGLAKASGPDTITSITPTGTSSPLISAGLTALNNAAGLHRAASANVYAFVDSAGDGATDAVYVIR